MMSDIDDLLNEEKENEDVDVGRSVGKGGQPTAEDVLGTHDADELRASLRRLSSAQLVRLLDDCSQDAVTQLLRNIRGAVLLDKAGSARQWVTLVKAAIARVNEGCITDRAANDLTNYILAEAETFPATVLEQLIASYIEAFERHFAAGGPITKTLELFAKFLSLVPNHDQIIVGGESKSAATYKDYVLDRVCRVKWRPDTAILMASMFRDLTLTDEQLGWAVVKLTKQLGRIDMEELPPLVYQLLLLSAKGHKRTILEGIVCHFDHLESTVSRSESQNDDELVDGVGLEQLRRIEGTVLLHINFAIKQDQELGKEYLKYLKSSAGAVMSAFNLALCLSLARVQRMEGAIFDYLKGAIVKSYNDARRRSEIEWIEADAFVPADIDTVLLSLIKCGWEDSMQGLVQLGVMLMDSPRPGFGNTSNDKVAALGASILVNTFNECEFVRAEILDIVLSRVVFKNAPSSHAGFASVLHRVIAANPHSLLEYIPKLNDAFVYLSMLSPPTATELLAAVRPLTAVSASFRDSLLVVLRKALFNKDESARQIAITGYLTLLQHLTAQSRGRRAQEIISSSQQSSQSVLASAALDNHSVCREILANARRGLSQQWSIRSLLYNGLEKVLAVNPALTGDILMLLESQFMRFYVADQDFSAPFRLDQCIETSGQSIDVLEPLPDLIRCLMRALASRRDDARAEYGMQAKKNIKSALDSCVKRLCEAEIEDFEVDRGAEYAANTEVGLSNYCRASLLAGTYEVFIEYVVETEGFTPTSTPRIIKLYERSKQLQDVLKEKASKKGKSSTMWKADAGLRLPAVAQILDVMLDLATEDDQRQRARNTLLENGGLARHVLKLANKHLTELMGGGSGAADSPTTDGSLFDMLEGMGASLFNSFTASINDQQAVKGLSLLLIECFQTLCTVVCERLGYNVVAFLDESFAESGGRSDGEGDEALHKHILHLQGLVRRLALGESGLAMEKEAVIVLGIVRELSLRMVDKNGTNYIQVTDWVQEITTEVEVEDSTLAKAFVTTLMKLTQHSTTGLDNALSIAKNVHGHLGDIALDEFSQEADMNIITSQNAATMAGLALANVDKVLSEVDWAVGKLKEELSMEDRASQRADVRNIESKIMHRMTMVSEFLVELSQTCLQGHMKEKVVKTLKTFYDLMTMFTKYVQAAFAKGQAVAERPWHKLLQSVGLELSQHIYTLINWFNHSDDGENQRDKKKKATMKARIERESRLIPNLIYAMEVFEGQLIQLSKKTKVNYMKYVKRATARDFKIQSEQLEQALANESSSEDEKEKGKRARATQGTQTNKKRRVEEPDS